MSSSYSIANFVTHTDFQTEIEQIEELIRKGVSRRAEEKANQLLKLNLRDRNLSAQIRLNLSKALGLQARYRDAFDALKIYESAKARSGLDAQTDIAVQTQIAVLYIYLADAPKSVSLLKEILDQATAIKIDKSVFGLIYYSLSRSYRALGQSSIARDYAFQSLETCRETGDRRGMIWAYIALSMDAVFEGRGEECIEHCQQLLNIVGDRPENYVLGIVYANMAGAYTQLSRPLEGIACFEKSIVYFEQTEHLANAVNAHNNLGISLMTVGEWKRAERHFQKALSLAEKINHPSTAMANDSLGELYLLQENFDEAEKYLRRAVEISQNQHRKFETAVALRTWGRFQLAIRDFKSAAEIGFQYLEISEQINHRSFVRNARLLLAEIYLRQKNWSEFEAQINRAKAANEDEEADLQISAYLQRLLGLRHAAAGDWTLAEYHLSRSLSLYQVLHDFYYTSVCLLELGAVLAQTNPKRAAETLDGAIENFRCLQIKSQLDKAEKKRSEIGDNWLRIKQSPPNIGLLTLRLAEAATSRELLLHEFLSILRQESRAKKFLIAQNSLDNKFFAAAFSGFTPAESDSTVESLQRAADNSELADFAQTNNFAIIELLESHRPPLYLLVHPRSGAKLADNAGLQPLVKIVEMGLKICALSEKNKTQIATVEADALKTETPLPGFVHSSLEMKILLEEIYKIRTSDITVLITGESGTGKELISRTVHALSNRKDRIFVPFNCTAVPKELAEGHLFGYRKGAFTGAVNDAPGVIRSADGGTLFLDEIGDLPLDVQPKLLRFLQEGEIHPLGEKKLLKVDVRVIAATNVGLEKKVSDGTFREDLYYRLNVIRLHVPPLRERRSEIPTLVNYYVNRYSAQFGKRNVSLTPQTMDLLMIGRWEGNVRQLCNELQRLVVRAGDNEVITPDHLSPELRRNSIPFSSENSINDLSVKSSFDVFNVSRESGTLNEIISQIERRVILETLQRHNGNVSRVAKELDISRRNLYLKLERYGLIKSNNRLSNFNVDS